MMTLPSWLGRAVGNRHRHAVEQALRRWRGRRRDDSARTRRKILISTQALDLATYGNKISARSGAYLTSIDGAAPGCEPELNPLLCCCAGFGCIRQVIEGTGTAFVEASGTVERKALKAGEKLVLDSASLVAYSDAELGVQMVPTWYAVWKSTSASGAPDNSSLSHFSAMARPSWLGRATRKRHRHAIEQA